MKKLVHGVGTNDANYNVTRHEYTGAKYPNGKKQTKIVWRCSFYKKWEKMLTRCYSKNFHLSRPTYQDCSVCEEWLTFSNFKSWMVTQEWEGMCLDKDLLITGNKVYSPRTCVFVVQLVNDFMGDCGDSRGKYLIGSILPKNKSRFISYCNNPFKDEGDLRKRHIGLFDTELEAHLAWKKRKHEYACELAESEYVTDERVANALKSRYKNYTILEEHIK